MLSKKEKEVLKKVLGHKIESFTVPGKKYIVFNGEHGWECTCPDFIFRGGTYKIVAKRGSEIIELQGCKHIAEVLKKLGYAVALERW